MNRGNRPPWTRGRWVPGGRGRGRGRPNWRGRPTFKNSNVQRFTTPVSLTQNYSQPPVTSTVQTVRGPYRGWKLYHLQEAYMEGSPTVRKVKSAEGFINRNENCFPTSDIEDRKSYPIDLKLLEKDEVFCEQWPTFRQDLVDSPEHTINSLGLALHQFIVCELENELMAQIAESCSEEVLQPVELAVVRARVINFEPILQLKNLKANYFGKLVTVRGTIIRVGNIKLQCTWLAFRCTVCESVYSVKQLEGVYMPPTRCSTEHCRSRNFTPLHSSPLTQTTNWQSVRLQELAADNQQEGGRVPRTVECELTEDLLDSCIPGDVLTVTGIVKVTNSDESNRRRGPNMFLLHIDAVSVVNSKSHSTVSGGVIEFSTLDYYAIKKIHAQKALFWLLVNSLCPLIYGHEMVKAGLLLTMFGGTRHNKDIRSDPHCLIVGDPGLGKSQMLQACASVAPRGVYVCGNTSSSAGLTVTLTRESGGNYTLEAGALVLADQGCCCIDEFDKMHNQHQALLEAMEQQSISIAKAGIICSLPARTSILAAANPVGGHYNRAKTVSENLRMGSALLSRFDLVFILLDEPSEVFDSLLSEHVMSLHSGRKVKGTSSSASFTSNDSDGLSCTDPQAPLRDRLRAQPGEAVDHIPHQLLRKYIAYAHKYVHPRLNMQAAQVLQTFYLQLRKQYHTLDSTPVTTRQLKSLIRLTEARAKLELREEATEQDALDVIEIMRHSLIDTLSDGFGGIDFTRSQHGSGMSSKNQAKKFINALQKRADIQCRSVFTVQEMKEVGQLAGVQVSDFFSFLTTLNDQGFLLKKGPKLYQLLSVDH